MPMTEGEKMIWAAAFAQGDGARAAMNAKHAVERARAMADSAPDAEWAPMLREMLERHEIVIHHGLVRREDGDPVADAPPCTCPDCKGRG